MGKVVNFTNNLKTEEVFIKVGELAPIKLNDSRSNVMKALALTEQDDVSLDALEEVVITLIGKKGLKDIEKELGELSLNGFKNLFEGLVKLVTGEEVANTGDEFRGK